MDKDKGKKKNKEGKKQGKKQGKKETSRGQEQTQIPRAVSSGIRTLTPAEVQEYLDQGFVHARMIIEMMGGPAIYIQNTLTLFIEKLKREQGVMILKEEFSEPEQKNKLHLVFVELELLVKDAATLTFLCFDYMPSSIEIIEPQEFNLRAPDFSGFLNDLQARLHRIDMIVKEGTAHNKNLLRNTNLLLRNLIIVTLSYKGPTGLTDLSKYIGVGEQELGNFLKEMMKEGWIREEKGRYVAVKK